MTAREDLWLDQYDSEGQARWCWKRGYYSSQAFDSEEAALDARDNGELELSRLDGGDALVDLLARKSVAPPFDYWVVEGAFVVEPYLGGRQLGELPAYELPSNARTLEMTQAEFDGLMEDFYMREGHYPDT